MIGRLLPEGLTPVARTLLWGRGLRAFADGFVSLLLPAYLTVLGFSPLEVGIIATATLLGSAALTLWVGMAAHRFGRQELLVAASLLMILTGTGFLVETDYFGCDFVDFFTVARIEGRWWITNKTYAHTGGTPPAS